ncbi:MAG TPA: delta-60 repeat domain-containing protein, partial [Nitrospiraceae bacterium]|nr:delta-60 repeat domain-containing protein [Nitrospiraceae bacterium]
VDPAFSTGNSFPSTSSMGCPQTIEALMPTSSGKLYVGGTLNVYNGVSVSSLLRLNQDGTLDSTFMSGFGAICNIPTVGDLAPAGDGTGDLYATLWVGPLYRLHDTGAGVANFKTNTSNARGSRIAVTQDGSGDVLLSADIRLFRYNSSGELLTAPTFIPPTMEGGAFTIVPIPDDTGDVYIGGTVTTYNGAAVNHFARIHADGSLASIVSSP